MIDPRSLARLISVKSRLERVRSAEFVEATIARDDAARGRDSVARTAADVAIPLHEISTRSVREQSEVAFLVARARQDLSRAEDELERREAFRDESRAAANAARREVMSLERAQVRAADEENRESERRERNVDDDRAAQRWRFR